MNEILLLVDSFRTFSPLEPLDCLKPDLIWGHLGQESNFLTGAMVICPRKNPSKKKNKHLGLTFFNKQLNEVCLISISFGTN